MLALCISWRQFQSKDKQKSYSVGDFLYLRRYSNGTTRFCLTPNGVFGDFDIGHLYNLNIDLNGYVIDFVDLGESESIDYNALVSELTNR